MQYFLVLVAEHFVDAAKRWHFSFVAPSETSVFASYLPQSSLINGPPKLSNHSSIYIGIVLVSSLVDHVKIAIDHPWLCRRWSCRGDFSQEAIFLGVICWPIHYGDPEVQPRVELKNPSRNGEVSQVLMSKFIMMITCLLFMKIIVMILML